MEIGCKSGRVEHPKLEKWAEMKNDDTLNFVLVCHIKIYATGETTWKVTFEITQTSTRPNVL